MSIRPLDHNVMVPKTQEVSNMKQTENSKSRNIVESQFIQQEKTVERNSQKVLSAEETVYNKIKDEERSKEQGKSNNKREKKDKKTLQKDKINDPNRGRRVDIRI